MGRARRNTGRQRPISRVRADGQWYGYGPQVEDAVSGWLFPKRLMTVQRGRLVSVDPTDESLDDRDPIDRSFGVLGVGYTLITVTASDAAASEVGPATGTFTITRSGNVSGTTTVLLRWGGTAVNGTDYTLMAESVVFAAGETTQTLTITPVADLATEGDETVILAAYPDEFFTYAVAPPGNATVTISE